jgi:tRNA-dihydrouridine synthase 1
MSSEALLENPALFIGNRDSISGAYIDQMHLARRYLSACAVHPPPSVGHARSHLFKLLHAGLRDRVELREAVLEARSLNDLAAAVERLEMAGWEQPRFHTPEFDPTRSWYWRHRPEGGAIPEGGEEPEEVGVPLSRAEVEAAAMAKRERRATERRRRNGLRRVGGRPEGAAGVQGAAVAA